MSRYPEAEWRPIPGAQTGTYADDPDSSPVLVIHTTEGRTLASAEAAYSAKDVVPHFTADYPGRRFVQHVDTDRSASALRNEPGGVQTNRQGRVVQIELVGFADETHRWGDPQLRWIGERLALIIDRERIPRRWPAFVGRDAGTIATPTAPQRLRPAVWASYGGVVGHQHVPENAHWDPGAFPIGRALALAGDTDGDDFMATMTEAEKGRLLAAADAITRGAPEFGLPAINLGVAQLVWSLIAGATVEGYPAPLRPMIVAGAKPATVVITADQLDQLADRIVGQLGAPLAATLADLLAKRLAD